ncbi:hypothetical protein HHI36_019939 [Cryptolaemus montrouzieri]|uniref:Uncharacterized protein n=1 Tax=Cryptolaemus montrouzieri TaxID=559131 RepID=A0ABD2N981_9CUCU
MQINRQKLIDYPEDLQTVVNKQLDTKQLRQKTIDGMHMTIVATLNDVVKSYSSKSKKGEKFSEKTKNLLKRRKNLLSQNKRNTQEYHEVNIAAQKSAREDIQLHYDRIALRTIEEFKGIKVFRRKITRRKGMIRFKISNSTITENREEILKTVEEFYNNLCTSKKTSDLTQQEKDVRVLIVGFEDVLPITRVEQAIIVSLKTIKL